MASAEELREAIEAGQGALRRAIEGAGARWDQSPGGEEWSPRQVAEHAVGAELMFASAVAEVLGESPPEREEFSFASANEALAALSEAVGVSSGVYGQVADSDLERPAPFREDLAGVMALASSHCGEHAQQIGGSP